ncbi:hypothetical protein IV56_GL001127 [Lacticaseibacillus saniviri JCM 17471 = DSM 24301]|uniref:Uncharacterized protein n=2 Tax=Lacticaseibacillus saniviri TaxID=931533 RepID=A0A0R2N057_9LACO|nr:hypothetical protein IV56_GL001127 [Lacticaseibacillus saniviri JCM 17471 = DSM 24301]
MNSMQDYILSEEQIQAAVEASKNFVHPLNADQVIEHAIQDWVQWLLDEGFEGSYFQAHLNNNHITIIDMMRKQVAELTSDGASYVSDYRADARQTLLTLQHTIREMIDKHQLVL